MRIAALDIGTNTLLMTIAELTADGQLNVLSDNHSIVRLGEGVQQNGTIAPAAVERALQCLEHYDTICKEFSVDVRVGVATSAARRASNGQTVIHQLQQSFGASIQIIDGDEEARLTFLGTAQPDQHTTILDIGGGSTEIVIGINANIQSTLSLEMGAVRLTEKYFTEMPARLQEVTDAILEIRSLLSSIPKTESASVLIGVAGTPTTLAAVAQNLTEITSDRIDGYELTIEQLDNFVERFTSLSVDQIRQIPGVHPQRADILTAGTLILRELLIALGRSSLHVSTRGLRFGVLRAAAQSLSRRALARR